MSIIYNQAKIAEFIDTVQSVRTLQKEYFKTRDKEVLAKAKAAERRVDVMLYMYSIADIEYVTEGELS